jgi:hypothetical protein
MNRFVLEYRSESKQITIMRWRILYLASVFQARRLPLRPGF